MTTENELRQRMVDVATNWLGLKESDGSHRQIIDVYNSVGKGYKVTYYDAWCAAFVSAVGIKAALGDIVLRECSCNRMITLYKTAGRWVENDAYIPSPGDLIMYDWQDSGSGDNTGVADHVGLVKACDGKTITVIEGNMNDAVGVRTLKVDGKYIRGFCVPDYASKATAAPEYYTVVRGDTLTKIARKYSTTVKALRELNGIENPDRILVGQKIKIR